MINFGYSKDQDKNWNIISSEKMRNQVSGVFEEPKKEEWFENREDEEKTNLKKSNNKEEVNKINLNNNKDLIDINNIDDKIENKKKILMKY